MKEVYRVKSFIRQKGHQKWMVLAYGANEVSERLPLHWAKLDREKSTFLMSQAVTRLSKKLGLSGDIVVSQEEAEAS
jgi:hypothetical protein